MHVSEDHFIPEIIDSETGEVLEPGEVGELVITTHHQGGHTLLRYRTKDITRLNYEPCKCGRTFVRMDKPMGRSDDLDKSRGSTSSPPRWRVCSCFKSRSVPTTSWWSAGWLYGHLEVNVEIVDASLLDRYSELEKLHRTVQGQLHSVLGLDAKVNFVQPNSLERFAGKAKRVVDLRGIK